MTTQSQPTLAALLIAARREGRQIRALDPALIPASNDAGYAVNRLVAAGLGWEPLGWKIAGTTPETQRKLRLTTPIYGRTYRPFALTSPARLTAGALLDPLLECEFFVTLARDLPPRAAPWTTADIRDAIGGAHAGIEIAECRFPNAALPPLPAVLADGAASGHYIYGDAITDWRDGLADIEVILETDGAIRRRGMGADVLGDPLRPVLWLAEELRRHGLGLRAGEMISTGSATGMVPLRATSQVRAVFGGRAEVIITFDQ
jgi:2-keto-4-pentenoate hydratase